MGDIGQQLAAGAIGLREGGRAAVEIDRHAVEGARERADLVAAGFGRPNVGASLTKRAGRLLQRAETLVRGAEDEQRRQRRANASSPSPNQVSVGPSSRSSTNTGGGFDGTATIPDFGASDDDGREFGWIPGAATAGWPPAIRIVAQPRLHRPAEFGRQARRPVRRALPVAQHDEKRLEDAENRLRTKSSSTTPGLRSSSAPTSSATSRASSDGGRDVTTNRSVSHRNSSPCTTAASRAAR